MALYKIVTVFLVIVSAVLVDAASKSKLKNNHTNRSKGKKWAVLVAGSKLYSNYRHQADVCHAYQVLKKGGLKDENIIVFMYDDIAYNEKNPKKGVIINKPDGPNVYAGVPKDYTGNNVTVKNFFNVLLGNKSALTGGSGKVLNSGPNDHILIYYADHGSTGLVEMPTGRMYADDFIEVLKKKYEANSYAKMVIYMEACRSGSMFQGLLPDSWNIYATTASTAGQNSFASYCISRGLYKGTCLGDRYSVSWIENSEMHILHRDTLKEQYQAIKNKTFKSRVMEYGSQSLASRSLVSDFMVSNSQHKNHFSPVQSQKVNNSASSKRYLQMDQFDAELYHYRQQYVVAVKGSTEKRDARDMLATEIQRRKEIDGKMKKIADTFRMHSKLMLTAVRPAGKAVVDDWKCLKSMVRIYEKRCGKLTTYGLKYSGMFANMCNDGIRAKRMASALPRICSGSRTG